MKNRFNPPSRKSPIVRSTDVEPFSASADFSSDEAHRENPRPLGLWSFKKYVTVSNTVLVGVLIFSVMIRLFNLNYNSPFLDEASYIIHGKNMLQGKGESGFGFDWIGGMPFLYPVISTIFYNIGGIVGSRALNVFFGTTSIYLFYRIVKNVKLFDSVSLNRSNGIIAALLLSLTPIHLSLSRLAIYDMPAFSFFILAICLLQQAIIHDDSRRYHLSGTMFLIAALIKYSIVLVFPVVMATALGYVWFYKKNQLNSLLGMIINLLIGSVLYIVLLYSDLRELFVGKLAGSGDVGSIIFSQFFELTGIWYLFSIAGLAWLLFSKRYLTIILLLLSFVPLLMHLFFKNTVAIQQDTLFALIFILPLAAAFFTTLIDKSRSLGVSIAMVMAVIVFTSHTLPKTFALEHFWPNMTKAMNFLNHRVSREDRILAQSGAVAMLALEDKLPRENIVSPFVFTYKYNENDDAYKKAAADKYFTYILIDQTTANLPGVIKEELNKNYEPIYNKDSVTIYKVKQK